MVKEKLSGIRKRVAGVGKRLAYRKMKKTSFLLIADLCNVVIDKFSELYGSRSAGIKKFAEICKEESIQIIADIIETPILFGISFKSFLSKNLKDFPFVIEMIFHIVLGSKWSYFLAKPEYITAELSAKKVPQYILKLLHCPFCYNITKEKVDVSELEPGVTHGTWFAKLLEGIMQGVVDYLGLQYDVNCEETQCMMSGYKNGEVIYSLFPRKGAID
ncbi:MAG: hypothetical protein HWN65_05060 [Candidatus Helarchaeota archaeon]|nr:hypothetical protein [Candidatus Helarchaeota archaeon]